MSMKLLSRLQTKDSQQKEQTLTILRIQETQELAKKTNANMARLEADFNATLARNRSKWALEEEEHSERLKAMGAEIISLERRKEQALIPISLYKQEADKIMSEAKEIIERAKEKEELAEILQEKLEEKLTAVGDRENVVARKELQQKITQDGIEIQRKQTISSIEKLTVEMAEFQVKKNEEEGSLHKRKTEVAMAEISFNSKVEKYHRDLDTMKVWERQLKDERETLTREYARTKK